MQRWIIGLVNFHPDPRLCSLRRQRHRPTAAELAIPPSVKVAIHSRAATIPFIFPSFALVGNLWLPCIAMLHDATKYPAQRIAHESHSDPG